jgi:hypothetical protein
MGEVIDFEKLTDGEKTALLKIYRLWAKHREKSFPQGCRGEMIRGIDLDTLHQNFFGCVSSFLTRGVLTDGQKEYLYACDDDLGIVTIELQDYEGFYFRQMKTLTSAIVEYLAARAA